MKREKTGLGAQLYVTVERSRTVIRRLVAIRRLAVIRRLVAKGPDRSPALFSLLMLTLMLALALGVSPLAAVEEEISLGGDDRWRDIAVMSNVSRVEGFRGEDDLVLASEGLDPTAETELFLPFDQAPVYDRAGNYRLTPPGNRQLASWETESPGNGGRELEITRRRRFGAGAALFTGAETLRLTPTSPTLFAPGSMVGDFSVDFWLYTNVINDGRSVFRWENSVWNGSIPLPQELSATFSAQRLQWNVENLFVTAEGEPRTVRLRAARPLIPRRWSHHHLSYDASTGLLEYTVDGVPEAVAYATTTGREPGELLYGRVGLYGSGDIIVGAGMNGVIDELRVSRTSRPEILRTSLTGGPGEVISRVFDLGLRGSTLTAVEGVQETPGSTEIQLFYRIADELVSTMPREAIDAPWQPVPESGEIVGAGGRFLQLRALLLSGGDKEESPRLSQLSARYEPAAPAPPPVRVRAVPGNGSVRLDWSPVRVQGVRGYRVYYGTAPGSYFGEAAANGGSPLDAGSESSLTIDGLENGVLYFFAVESYDRYGNGTVGELSREVSARPMGWRE